MCTLRTMQSRLTTNQIIKHTRTSVRACSSTYRYTYDLCTWELISLTNIAVNCTQNTCINCVVECTAEYKAKFYEYAEGLKTGNVKYEEEFILDRTAGTVQCFVIVNGQRIKDHGLMKAGVENDHVFDDGRPTKVSNVTTWISRFFAFANVIYKMKRIVEYGRT